MGKLGVLALVCISLFLFNASPASSAGLRQNLEWTTKIILENGFEAKWITTDEDWITMEIKGPTSGWIAVGFSLNGAMKGADMIMGWIDNENGNIYIKDLHGVGNEAPVEDDSQDVELLGGEAKDGTTTIRFRRRWNTCDQHDYAIGEETVKLIWAFGRTDPATKRFNPAYHGRHERGVKNVNLRLPPRHTKFPEEEAVRDPYIKHFDLTVPETYIAGHEVTEYKCTMFKYPSFDYKAQIVGWKPIIAKENVPVVHHMVVYECVVPDGDSTAIFDHHVGRTEACFAPAMPKEWVSYCWTQPIVWTIGGEGEMFPSHTGMPLGEKHGGSTYFMLEMHYDNPELVPFKDESGLRFYYTERARQQDLSTIFIGKRFSTFHFIAPGVAGYEAFGGCTKECTELTIPPEGITATHALLHAHTVTKKLVLKHIRNGVELAPLAMDTNYDINYQQSRIIDPPVKIMPGDELYTYCEYDTRDRDIPLWGGITTNDTEMCHTFLTYYPKIELAQCQWQIEYSDFLGAVGFEKLEGDVLPIVSTPYNPAPGDKIDPEDEVFVLLQKNRSINLFEQLTIGDRGPHHKKNFWKYLTSLKWKDNGGRVANTLNRKLEKARNYAFCTKQAHARIPLKKYIMDPPVFKRYVDKHENMCALRQGSGSGIQVPISWLTITTFAALPYKILS